MKKVMNLYYEGFPVCLKEYSVEDSKIKVTFINMGNHIIKNVKMGYKEDIYTIELENSIVFKCSDEFSLYIENIDDNLIGNIVLISVTTNEKEYVLENYKKVSTLIKPKSISYLGREKYLYIYDFCKLNKVSRKSVKYLPQNYGSYWNCVCGETNFNNDECNNCKLKKEKVFALNNKYEEESYYTNQKINTIATGLIVTLVMYAIFILIQSVGGDFFFQNETKNSFFGTLNRIILPVLYMGLTGVNLYVISRYLLKIEKIITIINVLIIVYLNLVSMIFTINTAYNILFLIVVDLVSIISVISYYRKNGRIKTFNIVYGGLIGLFLLVSMVKVLYYNQYNLKIIDEGIYLNVEVDEETNKYDVPEKLDNIKVIKIAFNDKFEYNIKELYVSRYVNEVLMSSHEVLSKLETLTLSSKNESMYIKDGVLYNSNNIVEIVPLSVKSLTLDTEVIHMEAFKNAIGLEEIYIGKNVKKIEFDAFNGCVNLNKIVFSEDSSLELIDDFAFARTAIREINLPISLKTIGVGIFSECNNLEKLSAPFIGLKKETQVSNVGAQDVFTKFFCAGDYSQSQHIPNSLKEVEFYDITLMHNVTFYNAKYLEKIHLPEKLIYMGIRSFYGCESLKEFTISDGIEVIKESCFQGCKSLKKIIIPESVKSIDINAFKGCESLEEVIYLGDYKELEIASGNDIIVKLLNK